MSNRTTNIIAGALLAIMFFMAFFSMKGISLTMDELAHIPAGFSYLYAKDYRLNPEHPPLAKDLAALPLLVMGLNFPKDHPSWNSGTNNQWWFGNQFLFHSGNDPDKIMFFARIPMILLLVFLGWFVFCWARKLGGNRVGLLALTLFAFSPTFLAHGRLVTTDVAAALGATVATYFWIKFLKNPKASNIILAGITLGIALLLNFP
jgi:dolichyl-phosphate-mannose--protein O-mannosyl transferase